MTEQKKTATKSTRKTAKWIRNLRGTPVHLRLYGEGRDKPYRIELNRRGLSGDMHQVPASLTDDGTFASGIGVLFEIITTAEANRIRDSYEGSGGYQGIEPAQLVREQDTVIATGPAYDGKGLAPREGVQQRPLGPTVVQTPGSQTQQLAEGNAALPPNVNFDAPVKVERR